MIELIRSEKGFERIPIEKIWDNDGDQVLAYRRNDLIFVFNLHPSQSFADYGILVPAGTYETALDSDAKKFGGYGLVDDTVKHFTLSDPLYKAAGKEWLKLYIPSRTAVVLRRKK